MDTGATSHLTNISGTIPKLFNSHTPQFVLVGNGSPIPIHGSGNTTSPPPHPLFSLKNVLYTPHIIKNLISICKFTSDNLLAFSSRISKRGHLLRDTIAPDLSTRSSSHLPPPRLPCLSQPSPLLHGTIDLDIRDLKFLIFLGLII